jgi:DNA-binding CsgD family transcriptional regulator
MEQNRPPDERVRQLLAFDVAFVSFGPCGTLEYVSPSARRACGDPGAAPRESLGAAWRSLAALAECARRERTAAERSVEITGELGRCRATVHLPAPDVQRGSVVIVLHPHVIDAPGELRRLALTARESEVARLLAMGLAIKQIAGRLGLSYHTARHHTERIYSKLGVHGRVEVTRLVMEAADS